MRRHAHPVVSIAFAHRETVEQAIETLMAHGIARDRIEVITDPETAAREFAGLVRRVPFQVLGDAARGGLVGLIASATLSLVIVALSGADAPWALSIVQLLGPNVGTLGGALIGAVVGWFRHRQPSDLYCRVRQTGGILMLVHTRNTVEADRVLAVLGQMGGRDGIMEQAA
ncbi:MAG: hypothetical protein H7338_06145 [Candidatus Sericytochromatia bacterium]|nr:hypothetical protein [Candidatus Sericytochromatia bacterium]